MNNNGDNLESVEAAGVVTIACRVDVNQALRRAVAEIERRGLEVFAVIDHSGEAAEVDLTMPDTKLIVFGSPPRGTALMLEHPLIALELPLKLLIWETHEQRAFVSFNAPSYVAARFDLSAPETAVIAAAEAIARIVTSG